MSLWIDKSYEMLSPLVSWILSSSSSSSSSSSYSSDGEGLESSTANNDQVNFVNDNDDIDQNDDNDNPSSAGDTIPSAIALPDASPAVTVAADDRPATEAGTNTTAVDVSCPQKRRVRWLNDSRRQPQRLWTKEDEVKLLKGYLDYSNAHAKRGLGKPTSSLHNDVASFYDDVKPKLNVEFNKNQLVEKLRRLKRKHTLVLDRIKSGERRRSFRCLNEEAIFEISNKIWGDRMNSLNASSNHINVRVKIEEEGEEEDDEDGDGVRTRSRKRPRLVSNELRGSNEGFLPTGDKDESRIKGLVEETMRTCLSPLLKELMNETFEGLGLVLNPTMPLRLGERSEQGMNCGCGGVEDDKWRGQRIMELEMYSKKLEVAQDHIKAALMELRSMGGHDAA